MQGGHKATIMKTFNLRKNQIAKIWKLLHQSIYSFFLFLFLNANMKYLMNLHYHRTSQVEFLLLKNVQLPQQAYNRLCLLKMNHGQLPCWSGSAAEFHWGRTSFEDDPSHCAHLKLSVERTVTLWKILSHRIVESMCTRWHWTFALVQSSRSCITFVY